VLCEEAYDVFVGIRSPHTWHQWSVRLSRISSIYFQSSFLAPLL
ncbi:unnamed protein product, partial [Allacma fusca]